MAFMNQNCGSQSALCTKPKYVQFSMFTADDIRKIAVCKIISPMTFDPLGHPLEGGLYDKRLGPISDRAESCKTCQKNFLACPGHFGLIELPLPVVNPLFHKIVALLMRNACLQCFHLQIPAHVKYTLDIQLKLLAQGKPVEAIEVHELMTDLIGRYSKLHEIPDEELAALKQRYELATTADGATDATAEANKNIEDLCNKIVADVWKNAKSSRSCVNCKAPPKKLTAIKNKLIVAERQALPAADGGADTPLIKAYVSKPITPEQSRAYIRHMWSTDPNVMRNLFPVLRDIRGAHPTDIFYFELVPVAPSNVRPVNVVAGRMSEHTQTATYKRVLQDSLLLRAIIHVLKNAGEADVLPAEARAAYASTRGATALEKLSYAWDTLQADVDALVDNEGRAGAGEQGLKQVIEKKAGIIRMHMMGKRVNFAARSVITPDPNLNIDEIGVPEVFAKHLTYPVPVTAWNVDAMRQLIMNGPDVHPGAVLVEFEDGKVNRITAAQKAALAKRLLTPDGPANGFRGVKTVHRHLCNGDVLLLNRQPTLHRPSIMAHTARVLRNEKTLRLHYANCKAYNADFDGDEMNAHFPQNEVARAEAYQLANVAHQYLGPKDGAPLSGLIQDHMIAGVKMSLRGRFFDRRDYQQLVYQALATKLANIDLLPPAILKPKCLWSGKQILSTVIINVIPAQRARIHLNATAKIPAKAWQNAAARRWACGVPFADERTMSEAEVVIRHGELLVGILDKAHYGPTPYGLVHCLYELYGGACAIKLLSALAKLFTSFLQTEGFTLGVEDILVTAGADAQRAAIIAESRTIGHETICKALHIDAGLPADEIVAALHKQSADNPKLRAIVDRAYKSALDAYTNDINRACLPAGLIARFPHNNLQLMVLSGAKGSTVNTMQISCLLGQIELEGRRPPKMISGRSLPSFPVDDFSPRAGGYIDGRFMTGIQPQEFFFHCMAGREGLIDTAVKTSRSGYLQRCLIKHLEGLKVGYDLTVRDSDKSVIQFNYGEDGMDISKCQFLNAEQLGFLVANARGIVDDGVLATVKAATGGGDEVRAHQAAIDKWHAAGCLPVRPFTAFSDKVHPKLALDKPNKRSPKTGRTRITKSIVNLWGAADGELKQVFAHTTRKCPPPTCSRYQPDVHFGALNERLVGLLAGVRDDAVRDMLRLKAMQSLCAPGDPVGLLAAQSIGEPSTQMTLNTFHFAGRGEMNVTLGIPRLREILMMASRQLKTPSMEIPFRADVDGLHKRAERLVKILTRVTLADVLERIDVAEELVLLPVRQYQYTLRFHFLPYKLYRHKYNVKPKKCLKFLEATFFKLVFFEIKRRSRARNLVTVREERRPPKKASKKADDNEGEGEGDEEEAAAQADGSDSEDEFEDAEDAKTASKYRQLHDDQESDSETEQPAEERDSAAAPLDDGDDDDEVAAVRSHTVAAHALAENYVYDTLDHQWAELTFNLPLALRQVDLSALLRDVAAQATLWETPDIRRAITYANRAHELVLRTDGVNFPEMFKYADLLDLNRLYSNDIHKMAETYGIEAAAKVIVREVSDVFKVYGIAVDCRHLSLIADYMTFGGSFEPLNRKGMEASASPLQQMSFESSLTFLKAAIINGKRDDLQNPSACLMVGKPCTMGTGAFSLLQNLRAFIDK